MNRARHKYQVFQHRPTGDWFVVTPGPGSYVYKERSFHLALWRLRAHMRDGLS